MFDLEQSKIVEKIDIYLELLCIILLILLVFSNISLANHDETSILSPADIVRRFCKLDSEGQRLSSETFASILPLVTWEEEAGDVIFVILGYKIGIPIIVNSTATVSVEYQYLGSTDSIGFTDDQKRKRIINFKLVKQNGIWKIKEPVTAPHVYWETAIKYLKTISNYEPMRTKQIETIIKMIKKARVK
jgi:hypothetical protein